MPGCKPSTAPSATLSPLTPTVSSKPVVLYRDTNAWCPYCARVMLALEVKGIPYDTVLVDLRNKPEWYLKAVPTGLTPAARIKGTLMWESADILSSLESEFPEHRPLLPSTPAVRARALSLMEAAEDILRPGFRFLSGSEGPPSRAAAAGTAIASGTMTSEEAKLAGFKADFENGLAQLESVLAKSGGPFFLGPFSMVDVMFAPNMERQAAFLAAGRGYSLRSHPSFPRISRWFAALESLPAYQRVKCDDYTLELLMKRVFGLGKGRAMGISRTSQTTPANPVPSSPPLAGRPMDAPFVVASASKAIAPSDLAAAAAAAAARQELARQEAAGKLALNHAMVIADILKNSGLGALVGRLTTASVLPQAATTAHVAAAPAVASSGSSSSGLSVPLTWEQQAAADDLASQAGCSSAHSGSSPGADHSPSGSSSSQHSAPPSSSVSSDPCLPGGSSTSTTGSDQQQQQQQPLSGVEAWKAATPAVAVSRSNDDQVRAAIDETLRRVVTHLEQAAVGAAALAFFHNRASAPRDMSAAAVVELRAACMAVMRELY
ncbi:MAG: hypothetical protein WDW38_005190 [Sanguina aurantia]